MRRLDKEKFAAILNSLAARETPYRIAKSLQVSSRTVYEIIHRYPLFGGFVGEPIKARRKPQDKR